MNIDDRIEVIQYDYILSIDVGIKNCSYIILKNKYHKDNTVDNIVKDLDIVKFKNLDFSNGENCNSISLMHLNINVIHNFNREFEVFFEFIKEENANILILIEDQMSGRMKCIQNMMASYFIINHYETCYDNIVFFVSPKQKLKPFKEDLKILSKPFAGCNNHNKNKNKANFIMDNKMIPLMKAEFLDGDGNPKVFKLKEYIDCYTGLKKQDDMADAFLQALYYLLNPFTSAENELINNRYFK
jgi:hypothetical protein